jgi:Tol biopolymer transport system component
MTSAIKNKIYPREITEKIMSVYENCAQKIEIFNKKKLNLPIIFLSLIYNVASYANCTNNPVLQIYSKLPASLRGRLIYHSYISYSDGSSNLFLKDFRSNTLTKLNKNYWKIEDPINAHFSPNGRYITFMGKQNARWNIFIWKVGSLLAPVNLSNNTRKMDGRSEDPKFSSDGNYIVYKKNNDIAIVHLNFANPNIPIIDASWKITDNHYITEESMPYFSSDGKSVFYSQDAGEISDIYQVSFKKNYNKLVVGVPNLIAGRQGIAEYYPVVKNKFLFFVGWKDSIFRNDQIYLIPSFWYGQPIELSLNDCNANNSDPMPIDSENIIFSSTRNSNHYSLYIGNIYTGKVWSIGINHKFKNQLGATYTNAR